MALSVSDEVRLAHDRGAAKHFVMGQYGQSVLKRQLGADQDGEHLAPLMTRAQNLTLGMGSMGSLGSPFFVDPV